MEKPCLRWYLNRLYLLKPSWTIEESEPRHFTIIAFQLLDIYKGSMMCTQTCHSLSVKLCTAMSTPCLIVREERLIKLSKAFTRQEIWRLGRGFSRLKKWPLLLRILFNSKGCFWWLVISVSHSQQGGFLPPTALSPPKHTYFWLMGE